MKMEQRHPQDAPLPVLDQLRLEHDPLGDNRRRNNNPLMHIMAGKNQDINKASSSHYNMKFFTCKTQMHTGVYKVLANSVTQTFAHAHYCSYNNLKSNLHKHEYCLHYSMFVLS